MTSEGPMIDVRFVDVQCKRCGSSIEFIDCVDCDGDGEWEDDQDGWTIVRACNDCHGVGGFWICMSTAEWCEANPLPGNENVERHTMECR